MKDAIPKLVDRGAGAHKGRKPTQSAPATPILKQLAGPCTTESNVVAKKPMVERVTVDVVAKKVAKTNRTGDRHKQSPERAEYMRQLMRARYAAKKAGKA